MTNKKFRDDLAKEMRDKYNERNKRLEEAEKSSSSDGLKEQMNKEIMDNFNQEMEEMKSRPWYEEAKKTHLEEMKAKIKLAKSKKEYEDSLKVYEDAQIAHRWEVEQKITENSENKENSEIPQSLLDFRKKWEEEIDLDEDTKKKIMDAVNEIQKWAKEESDGSILVEFELWWKGYKTLDVNLERHSDKGYQKLKEYYWKTKSEVVKNEVYVKWMWWDKIRDRDNKELSEYVNKQRYTREMRIPTIEFQRNLVDELWDKAGLTKMSDKIAMWMYLTWNYGLYYLTIWDYISDKYFPEDMSCSLNCVGREDYRFFSCSSHYYDTSLCLIACE